FSNTNDITNEESIATGDNEILEGVGTITAGGFSNNNNIKSRASSGGSEGVRGNGNSKGTSSSGGSGAVRGYEFLWWIWSCPRKKPNAAASKVPGADTVSQRSKATMSACESQGFSNNNNIKSEASSSGSGAVRGNGNSKGMSSSSRSGAVRCNFHSKGMSSSGGSGG
nr:hypothetical protein [Tanacetum cinerariifolium]